MTDDDPELSNEERDELHKLCDEYVVATGCVAKALRVANPIEPGRVQLILKEEHQGRNHHGWDQRNSQGRPSEWQSFRVSIRKTVTAGGAGDRRHAGPMPSNVNSRCSRHARLN